MRRSHFERTHALRLESFVARLLEWTHISRRETSELTSGHDLYSVSCVLLWEVQRKIFRTYNCPYRARICADIRVHVLIESVGVVDSIRHIGMYRRPDDGCGDRGRIQGGDCFALPERYCTGRQGSCAAALNCSFWVGPHEQPGWVPRGRRHGCRAERSEARHRMSRTEIEDAMTPRHVRRG